MRSHICKSELSTEHDKQVSGGTARCTHGRKELTHLSIRSSKASTRYPRPASCCLLRTVSLIKCSHDMLPCFTSDSDQILLQVLCHPKQGPRLASFTCLLPWLRFPHGSHHFLVLYTFHYLYISTCEMANAMKLEICLCCLVTLPLEIYLKYQEVQFIE